MSILNKTALTAENNTNIIGQTTPESITPAIVGSMNQDIIDSMYNRIDDALTPAPINMTKLQLVTAIGGSTLNDKQWITITDRSDGFPLVVIAQGSDLISTFGFQIKSGVVYLVTLIYTGAGDLFDFSSFIDASQSFNFTNQIVIADSSKGAGKVLVSDANGKGTWMSSAITHSANISPFSMTGATALMMGIGGTITPTKSGKVVIIVSGYIKSGDNAGGTGIDLRTGTGTAPTNGTPVTGTPQGGTNFLASSTTIQTPFIIHQPVTLNVGTAYWIDIAVVNANGLANQVYQVNVSCIEQ